MRVVIKKVTWAFGALAFILVILTLLPNPFSKKLNEITITLLKPPLELTESSSRDIISFLKYKNILYENRRLKEELGRLKIKVTLLEEAQLENKRLYKLLDFKKEAASDALPCRVIGRDSSNWFNSIILNKGRKDGIKEGDAVIGDGALAGKVIEVYAGVSKVILITDPSLKIAAKIQRTRDEGILEGIDKNLCRLKYLPLESKILVGDKVITSNRSQIYPEGLLMGEVISISQDASNLYKIALIRPEINLLNLEEALCIRGKKPY